MDLEYGSTSAKNRKKGFMAHLAYPCGNSLSNSCDGDEAEYYFVENGVLEAHQDDFAFFELEYNDLSTEIWKCDVCDKMMFFDVNLPRFH